MAEQPASIDSTLAPAGAPIPAAGPEETSGLAIASLVLSLAVFIIGPLGSIPGIICGHLALGKINQNARVTGRGIAIAGLVIGYLGLVFFVLFFILMIGILVPALSAARSTAQQMVSNSYEHDILNSEFDYAQKHQNHFSPNLSTLYHENLLEAKKVLPLNSQMTVPSHFAQWQKSKQDRWFAKNAGYVMVPGQTNNMDSDKIALFEKPKYAIDGLISVAWDDGHIKSVRVSAAKQMIQKQTGHSMEELIQASERTH